LELFKKISTGFLLTIYLVPASATAELLKLPLLLKHYSHHETCNKGLGIFSFLKAHYNNENDNKSKEDKQLPFKAPHPTLSQSLIALPTAIFASTLIAPEFYHCQVLEIPDHLKLSVEYNAVICQPPQVRSGFTINISSNKNQQFSYYKLLYKTGNDLSMKFFIA